MDKIYGRKPVIDAIDSGVKIYRAYIIKQNSKIVDEIVSKLNKNNIEINFVDKRFFDKIDMNHQGVCVEAESFKYKDLSALNSYKRLIILDQIEDPHNLGAIIRSAESFGFDGVIIPERRSASVSPIVYKTSAGAINNIDIIMVKNINKAIEEQIAKTAKQDSQQNSYGITVKGESNLMVRFAKCCNPVPGDEILGYITKGRGVSVHRKDCQNLKNLIETDGERVVEVSWGTAKGNSYSAEIQVMADDREGLLADIMSIITDLKLQLSAVNANLSKDNYAYINIKIKIQCIDSLQNLMKRIKNLRGVVDVYRVNN